MKEKDAVAELDSSLSELKCFVAENAKLIEDLKLHVGAYNEARKVVADRARSMSKETRKPVKLGLISTKLSGGTTVNFDALEEIVTDEEFRNVVDIKYSFCGDKGKAGKEALLRLEGQYGDRLAGLHVESTPTVTVLGPKEIDLGVLEGLG